MRGYDPDGDSLAFGVTGAGSGLVRVEARDEYSADVFLRRDLDHEVRHDEYSQMSGLIS